ncbi:phage protein NinX family protein [Proteus mirabilis]|uniref:phage protein NinX family protein n=1 Tax=Proteus mirabilis TaxID=584 RepID=UPI001FAC3770|nr:phage protein NinX family protein [Proteus mirabilis]MCI9802139.1 DUF2591 family protein [Proteus mirabilis]MCI9813571.1 DUF2591 family protein [Proteus mirabilis]
MKIKTSKLKGLALDWAVGKAVGVDVRIGKEFVVDANNCVYSPSSSWVICGEFVDTYAIELINEMLSNDFGHYQIAWSAICNYLQDDYYDGDTPQEAICRAVVMLGIGNEVEIPEELLNG